MCQRPVVCHKTQLCSHGSIDLKVTLWHWHSPALCHWYRPKGTMGKCLVTQSHGCSELGVFLVQLLLVLPCSGVLHIPERLSLAETWLCMSSLHAVWVYLSCTAAGLFCLFLSFNFISVFIASQFWGWFFLVCVFSSPVSMFDILQSFYLSSVLICRSFRCRR